MKVKEYLNNQELSSDNYMSEEEIKKEMNNQVTAVKINTAVVG